MEALLSIPVPWVYILSYLLGAAFELAVPARLGGAWTTPLGALFFLAGAVIATWAQVLFRRARTTTIPGQVSSTFVTRGPYRISRNPMYLGLSLAYIGEAGLLNQVWPLVLLPFVIAYVNWTVIPLEESRLHETFGDRYDDYRTRVRRWI
jgi:protein-S-isoprenylcysteine O-methyltransferase Ste14